MPSSPTAPRRLSGMVTRLLREARTCCRSRKPPGQRQLQPRQVAVAYGVHGVHTAVSTACQTAAHAAHATTSAGAVALGAAAAALLAGMSSPVEAVKTGLDVGAGRRKAGAARRRIDAAQARLNISRSSGDAAQTARDWLDRRHALEAWVATRRCFQGTAAQLRRRRARWQRELVRLEAQRPLSPSVAARRDRLRQRLDALKQLGPRRVVELRSSAVTVEKRLKEGISAGRNLGGVLGIVSGLAAGASPFLALLGTVFLPLLLPVLLLVDGVAGSVEATQLIRRAQAGRVQLAALQKRVGQARRSLSVAPVDSLPGMFRRGLETLQRAGRHQDRQWQRELRQGWVRRIRSAAFVVLAPVALGVGIASLVAAAVTPAGWAVAAVLGAVVVGYCIAQAVLNHQAAQQAQAVVVRQKDHAQLARRAGACLEPRTGLLTDPSWADNEYLAIEHLVRVLTRAVHDPAARSVLDDVFARDLACGRRWREQVFRLAAAVPDGAPPQDPDIARLSEALMRRFGLPVPKARHRPGAA